MIPLSLKIFARELVDYAGLFPPSELPLDTAIRNFARYTAGESAWMLGRFVLPVSKLTEFAEVAHMETIDGASSAPWRLSVLASADLPQTIHAALAFNHQPANAAQPRMLVDTIEMKAGSVDEVRAAAAALHSLNVDESLITYIEVPADASVELLSLISRNRLRAKLRTGGIPTSSDDRTVPPVKDVLSFIRRCNEAHVAFKATAGLHHAVCGQYPFTYREDSLQGTMHGFVNFFLAGAFLRAHLSQETLAELLREVQPSAFLFDSEGAEWRGHRISNDELDLARRDFCISFGSCSFEEPVAELKTLKQA